MVIDFHTHIFSDVLARRAIETLESKANIKAFLNGTKSDLFCSMQRSGIDISLVMPIATKPSQITTINQWAFDIRDSHIIPFATIHPEDTDYKNHIMQIKKMGFKGIKMHPDYQDFFVDDEKMFKIYNEIFESGLILLLHSGVDVGYNPPYHCTPERLRRVLDNMEVGNIVAAHLGGHAMWDKVEKFLVGQNLYFDTSMGLEHYDIPVFKRILKNHGCDKILFATDSPWSDQKDELTKMRSLSLTNDELENILYKNACTLLGQKF